MVHIERELNPPGRVPVWSHGGGSVGAVAHGDAGGSVACRDAREHGVSWLATEVWRAGWLEQETQEVGGLVISRESTRVITIQSHGERQAT